MGITERRERERVEVRRKILDAARDLFVSEGYERVTMRRIAGAIEYSPTAIYLHFEDKDDLVLALCREDFGRLLEAMESQAPPDDPIEWIRQLGRAYAEFAINSPNHYRFMFMTPMRPEHKPEPTDPGPLSFDVLRTAVAKAIEIGVFRPGDVDTIAQVLWASIHGAVALLITLRPDCWPRPPVPNLVGETIEAGLRAFRVTPEVKD
ncbi:MAG TPA: TetR/AcrR family transcriptional regulator [Actinomycetota bacterium]|jgi:AcrR family transcriptional regulator|nr:TetR/AcrR family transcriptional regulator [Actinomycetota bacterium]